MKLKNIDVKGERKTLGRYGMKKRLQKIITTQYQKRYQKRNIW